MKEIYQNFFTKNDEKIGFKVLKYFYGAFFSQIDFTITGYICFKKYAIAF